MVVLERKGSNMARRILGGGHDCVVVDVSAKVVQELVHVKAVGPTDLRDFVKKLEEPRALWLMVPAAVVDKPALNTYLTSLEVTGSSDGANSLEHRDSF